MVKKFLLLASCLGLFACGSAPEYEIVVKEQKDALNAHTILNLNEKIAFSQHRENCESENWQGENTCHIAYLTKEEALSDDVLNRFSYKVGTIVVPLGSLTFMTIESYGDGYNISIRTTYGRDGDAGPEFVDQELQTPVSIVYKREKPS